MGTRQIWCYPTSFLVLFLSSFVYTNEQKADTGYKQQKAEDQYYQLVSIHKDNVIRYAERTVNRRFTSPSVLGVSPGSLSL